MIIALAEITSAAAAGTIIVPIGATGLRDATVVSAAPTGNAIARTRARIARDEAKQPLLPVALPAM